MNDASPNAARKVAGLEPWLPWPLSAWRWWTRPVRAEGLAALRIGLAACLLIDVLTSYGRQLFDFFGQDGLGGAMFSYYSDAPKLNWSLLRGFGDPLVGTLSLTTWLVLTGWFALDFWGRLSVPNAAVQEPPGGTSVVVWLLAGVVYVLGVWSRSLKEPGDNPLPWTAPLAMSSFATLYLFLELYRHLRGQTRDRRLWLFLASAVILFALTGGGFFLPFETWSKETAPSLGHRLLLSWQEDRTLLALAYWVWAGSALCLLIGLCTRTAAVMAWALSVSFANVNPNIDNAGDTIRIIILFYLMLCPCGAVWSLDRIIRRRLTGEDGPTHVWPWPLRLLFVQLIFVYWMNGLYKLTGANWVDGDSLRYVLCDVTLTRYSFAQVPLPLGLAQLMTWSVLAWEVSFPLLVLFRWTRWLTLWFGVAFHLGILATMELGGFVPYVLCLYLPLLPWDRLDARPEPASL